MKFSLQNYLFFREKKKGFKRLEIILNLWKTDCFSQHENDYIFSKQEGLSFFKYFFSISEIPLFGAAVMNIKELDSQDCHWCSTTKHSG